MSADGPRSILPAAAAGGLRFSRRLERSPFSGKLYASELASLSSLVTAEYGQLAALEVCNPEPVLLAWSQYYRLLAELVSQARACWDAPAFVLVEHHAPNPIMPLPADLVAADVLLTHEPRSLADQLRRSGMSRLMLIEDDLRRDGHEPGRNVVSITMYGLADADVFLSYLRASALARCGFEIAATDLELVP